MSGSYFLWGSIFEKSGKFGENGRFSGRIWPERGNTTRADMAGLGSKGLYKWRRLVLNGRITFITLVPALL